MKKSYKESARRWLRAVPEGAKRTLPLLPLVAGIAFASADIGEKAAPAAGPRSGAVTVRVTFPDGAPAAGAAVTIGRQRFTADGQGTVTVPGGISAVRGVASADAGRQEGGFLGFFRKSVRYAAFQPVGPAIGAPVELRLPLSNAPDMDQLCRTCHPDRATPEHGVIRCAHKSGVPMKAALVARVQQFNRENDELRKSGKPAYPRISLEMRKKGVFGEPRAFLVCESCHSNHVETGQKAYVFMPFAEKSILCRGCHV